jgi:hypothetical protein
VPRGYHDKGASFHSQSQVKGVLLGWILQEKHLPGTMKTDTYSVLSNVSTLLWKLLAAAVKLPIAFFN